MAEALLNTMSRDQQEWENQMGYERFVHDCSMLLTVLERSA